MTDDVNGSNDELGFGELPAPAANAPVPLSPPSGGDWTIPISVGVMQLAGLTSIGAGAIHALAAGLHAETTTLSRLFVGCAIAQLAVGLWALAKGGRIAASLVLAVNLGAVVAWGVSRLWGVSWIEGLEATEAARFMDSACAAFGAIAAVSAAVALVMRRTKVSTVRLGVPAFSIGSIALVAMLVGAGQTHGHGTAAGHDDTGASAAASVEGTAEHSAEHAADAAVEADHAHTDEAAATDAAAVEALASTDAAATWPRAWNPAEPIDLSGVPGVTREQQLRAAGLIQGTLEDLPEFADVDTIGALGYQSIGDAGTSYEHYVNYGYIADDKFLDPTAPESLVYRVNGDGRTLVSAMFIASQTSVDDPELVDYGGSLMTWHVHENLCWAGGEDGPRVVALVDAEGNCPPGSANAGGKNPMVHVWIVPHECGPFAALEGHGAGQTGDGTRTDQCSHEHGGEAAAADGQGTGAETANALVAGGAPSAEPAAAAPVPYDPTMPIDLSGTAGVTPQQQAFAENTISNTLIGLPQWSDPAVAEEAGFRSIRDGATGFEHYIQWDWIDDDVYLDPDQPESLVYAVQQDGSRELVSAMYMLPDSYTLDQVPDWGGALMQWHIHSDLCFDMSDPAAPRVGGLTDAEGGCTAPLVKMQESPMIHVWITPHPCGPFAALEGVGAGQVAAGEEHLCDHDHGSG